MTPDLIPIGSRWRELSSGAVVVIVWELGTKWYCFEADPNRLLHYCGELTFLCGKFYKRLTDE